jgi:hypothetical protein
MNYKEYASFHVLLSPGITKAGNILYTIER